jgi:hypothetical protein
MLHSSAAAAAEALMLQRIAWHFLLSFFIPPEFNT